MAHEYIHVCDVSYVPVCVELRPISTSPQTQIVSVWEL